MPVFIVSKRIYDIFHNIYDTITILVQVLLYLLVRIRQTYLSFLNPVDMPKPGHAHIESAGMRYTE